MWEHAEFTMNDGKISGNQVKDSYSYGGGVYVEDGTFTMEGGEISGNTAAGDGGGVYVYSGTFTMKGGEISGNTASDGGHRMAGAGAAARRKKLYFLQLYCHI